MQQRNIIEGGFYRHFKNKLYQVKSIAYHSETGEKMVVYQALYGDFTCYVRPFDMFVSEVDHKKYPDAGQTYRFEQVCLTKDGQICSVKENGSFAKSDSNNISDCVQHTTILEEQEVNPFLLKFLDCDTFEDKLQVFIELKDNADHKLMEDIAAVLDVALNQGSVEEQYESLKSCLLTFVRFEDNRLR